MGLDSYIYRRKPGDTRFDIPDVLVSGIFSGHGSDGSFRGKWYEPLISVISNGMLTLYEDEADEDWLGRVASTLEDYLKQLPSDIQTIVVDTPEWGRHEYAIEEVRALAKLFRQGWEKGCKYSGWW